ncbi:MAG: dihydrolipoyllysine-residue acetyltransferase [Calditrichaeota bacterium]|nr:dihydrolipoyllysine-residue acetyltransferase [Calditrichota bacterium]
MSLEIKLPELGDNIESGTVVSVFVAEGDTIAQDQALIELETDKAVIEVPSSSAGKVKKILVKSGDEVKIGQAIVELDSNGAEAPKPAVKKEEKPETAPAPVAKPAEEKKEPEAKAAPSAPAGDVEFKIPNMGDNIETGTVTSVLVNVGDEINFDQGLVELETDKAVVEVPSDVKGTVKEILVKSGDTVKIGQKVMVISAQGAVKQQKQEPETPQATTKTAEQQTAVKETLQSSTQVSQELVHDPVSKAVFEPPKSRLAAASPTVRRFAREIGVDIHDVPGNGPGGRISIDDVKAYSKMLHQQKGGGAIPGGVQAEALPDFSKWGEVSAEPMNKLRQTSAKHLSYAWVSIPHVTQFDKADITELEQLRKTNGKKAEAMGGKLTMTAILIKVIEAALKKFPQFNASIDMAKQEIIYKKYFNIGIAVATDRGLLVPVIRDVDKKNILHLAVELTEVSKKARDKKLSLEDMQGGNFSISNLGGLGGTAFTPIVNAPEVAILGVSRSEIEPKYIDGEFKPRLMMPLSLSYDHRIIDGADAAIFLRWVCEVLEQPFNVLLEG